MYKKIFKIKLKLLLFCLFFIFIRNLYAVDYTQDPSCLFAFTLEVDENPIQDNSANNLDGILKGANEPDFVGTGNSSTTYSTAFYDWDDVDDYIYVSSAIALGDMDFTIVCWIKPDIGYDDYECIMVLDDEFRFCTTAATSKDLVLVANGSSNIQRNTTFDGIDGGNWHHVAVTWDYSAGTIVFYVNNVVRSQEVASGFGYTAQEDNKIYIGSRNSSGLQVFDGSIDEVALFKRILTVDEVSNIYNYGLTGAGGAPSLRPFLLKKQ